MLFAFLFFFFVWRLATICFGLPLNGPKPSNYVWINERIEKTIIPYKSDSYVLGGGETRLKPYQMIIPGLITYPHGPVQIRIFRTQSKDSSGILLVSFFLF